MAQKSKTFDDTVYTEWANHHLQKTGVERVVEDLPKDISDGVLLADIVQFVCGLPVERIHSNPRTAKQKLHNLERCLQVLQQNRVVLNDVTVQGLHRADLKCVLALFFHLSRFKQKEKDCIVMGDNKSTQKRCLRPPSTVGVGRKSRSFNANDRNRVNLDISNKNTQLSKSKPPRPVEDLSKSVASPENRTSGVQINMKGWKSKSMNVKHSATTKLVEPKSTAPNLQTFKPEANKPAGGKSTGVEQNRTSANQGKKVTTATRISSPSRADTVARKPHSTVTSGVAVRTKSDGSNNISLEKPLKTPASKTPASKPPHKSLDRPGSRKAYSARSIPNPVRTESEAKNPRLETKPNSMISRLRKLGSPAPGGPVTSTPATASKTRPVSATKIALRSVATNSKKRAESCPPTSRTNTRSAGKHKQVIANSTQSPKPGKSNQERETKNQPGLKSVKSSFGKGLLSKSVEKKSPNSSPKKSGAPTKAGKKAAISKSEICPIIPMVTHANQPMEPIYTNAANILAATDCEGIPPMNDDVSAVCPSSNDVCTVTNVVSENQFVKPVSISIPGSRDMNRPYKTAMVAPIIRRATPLEPSPVEELEKPPVNEVTSSKLPDTIDCSNMSPVVSREMAVKGIAHLRHNLEATMNSLRTTQLRHHHHDDAHRRISAQFDDENPFSEESPMSRTSALYRSHHNLTCNRTGLHLSLTKRSNSPQLHAGETLARRMDYKLPADQFSSLQRTRSARYPRSSWTENIGDGGLEFSGKEPGRDEGSSASSDDLSDFIDELSTDELSSTNPSPQHQMKSQDASEARGEERKSWAKLGNRLSKSTMVGEPKEIDGGGKTLKYLKRKSMMKTLSRSGAGSSIVGSRLATTEHNTSPCPSPSQQSAAHVRSINSYRSLPRPGKNKISEVKFIGGAQQMVATGGPLIVQQPVFSCSTKSSFYKVSSPSQSRVKSSLTFKRSPSLQKLFGMGKSKQNTTEAKDDFTAIITNPNTSSPASMPAHTEGPPSARIHYSLSNRPSDESKPPFRQDNYNSLTRPHKATREQSPLSYLSLPRRNRAHLSVAITTAPMSTSTMTWTPPKRPKANSAYSITPTDPYLDLWKAPSLNIDNQDSTEYPVPDQTDTDLLKREVSDWPLPALVPSSVAASNPNVASSSSKFAHTSPHKDSDFFRTSMLGSTSSLLSDVQSVSAFEDGLSAIENNFQNLTKEAQNTDTELQELKHNIENRIKTNSSDGHSSSVLRKKTSGGSVASGVTASSVDSIEDGMRKKKKHWFRESLKTAFGKRKSRSNLASDIDDESSVLREEEEESEVVAQLKEELLKKERKLTDIRLEALTSQHQLHQMQDAINKMKSEIESLRQENERLNKLGLEPESPDTRPQDVLSSLSTSDRPSKGEKRLLVKIQLPDHMIQDDTDERISQSIIGVCYIAHSIGWLELDRKVQVVFENFCLGLSANTSLDLHPASISTYKVGETSREIDGETPDLLPCGYIVGSNESLIIKLKDGNTGSCDALAFEMLIDRTTVEQYVRLVLDHGRVMLSGPAGTGKSTLANRLAEHVVRSCPEAPGRGKIVRLDRKHRSENEIVEYLHQLSEDCGKPESSGKKIPVVLILDHLHRSSTLKEAIIPLLTTPAHSQLPYLIGVAENDGNSGLEFHHEFRWILCSNHSPPVMDFLSRSLRQSLCQWEASHPGSVDDVITRVVLWLPDCWKHVNKCIERHNSADVTLGPRLFAKCPMDGCQALDWFTNLWNFSLVPYVISAVKQGSRKRNKPVEWSDPLDWVKESWPWKTPCSLLPIRAEDVASDNLAGPLPIPSAAPQSSDPLLSMMLKLREAASSYESDTSHDESFERNLDKALGDLS